MEESKNQELIQLLGNRIGEKITGINEPYGLLTFTTSKDVILDVLKF